MFNLIDSARKLYRYNSAVDIFVSFTRNETSLFWLQGELFT